MRKASSVLLDIVLPLYSTIIEHGDTDARESLNTHIRAYNPPVCKNNWVSGTPMHDPKKNRLRELYVFWKIPEYGAVFEGKSVKSPSTAFLIKINSLKKY